MSKVVLIIRPTADNVLYIYLWQGKSIKSTVVTAPKLDQALLPLIDTILRRNTMKLKQVAALGLVQEPMSLASQRLALSVVNSLAWGLSIPTFVHRGDVSIPNLVKSYRKAKKGFLPAEYHSEVKIGKK